MDLQIMEKVLFFQGFFNISKKPLEALRNAVGDPFGTPWGALGDAWGGLGDALGSLWGALGPQLGPTWAEMGQLEANFKPT